MPRKSLRQERHDLTRRLRADGRTWVEISAELRTRWPDLTVLASLRLAHGWTQQEVANEWAHHWPEEAKTSKEIGLWENWRPTGTGRRPSLTTLDKLARVYQCSVADLLADVYDHRRLDPASTDAAPEPTGASADSPAQERLESITSELVATVLGSGRTGDQPAEGATPPALVLASRVQQVWRLRQLADYRSLGRILPGLVRDAEAAARVSSTDQEQAVHAAVHAYNAASSFLKTVGDCDVGLIAADRAVGLARLVDDPLLICAALLRLANVLLSAERPEEAKAAALQAGDLLGPGAMRGQRGLATWGGVLLTAAVAAARSGHESDARELLGEARTASRLLVDDHADVYCIFGPTNLAVHDVQVAVELGNGTAAVQRAEHVIPSDLPPSLVERRGQFLISLAHGHALCDQDETAVTTLRRAHRTAPQETSLSREVHSVIGLMLGRERIGAAPGLRDLATAVGFKGTP